VLVKRVFDLTVSAAALVVLSPVLLLVAAAIRLSDGGPSLYRGPRIGLGGRGFDMLKFRTMVLGGDKMGPSSTSTDDPRITAIGRVLRRYKLDELPQLLNVLKGDMSFVGPRPQVAWAVELYSPTERDLLSVRPGLTDYASIRFANEAEILRGSTDPDGDYLRMIAPTKIRLGLEYVRTRSLVTDIRIIVATAWAVAGGNPDRILGRQLSNHT
jgi:lipopolysaccharide/colanic/teichoic acid biosynthesis glycosyltransferase